MAKSTQKRLNSEFLANGGILEITQGEVYLKTHFLLFFLKALRKRQEMKGKKQRKRSAENGCPARKVKTKHNTAFKMDQTVKIHKTLTQNQLKTLCFKQLRLN
ncbi:hypothetical protein QBS70_03640 [Cronobacter sakazakii]|nr:hypothetical protein [Cronobacter sakazakii]